MVEDWFQKLSIFMHDTCVPVSKNIIFSEGIHEVDLCCWVTDKYLSVIRSSIVDIR